jgi:hypothetical protein
VKALLHAELLKLRSTRTTAGLLLATLGLVALTVAVSVPDVGGGNGPFSLGDPDLWPTQWRQVLAFPSC